MAELNLPNVRKGGDITFRVGLTDNGVSVDWSGLEEKRAFLMADQQKLVSGEMSVAVDAEDPTVLVCTYSGDDRMYLGVNSVVIRAKYMGRLKVYDKKAVNIVGRTSAASGVVVLVDPVVPVQLAVEEVDTTILNNAIDAAIAAAERAEDAAEAAEHMVDIHRGPQGYSAYEIAVQEGYEGTVTDWLASLVGPQGKSAYEVAVEEGFVGTEEEWLLSLVGPQGLSAYQVAVAEGFEGTVTEWLDSLVGPTGATPNLTIGTVETGTAGSTAEATITGTAANPVLNLRIPQGAPGVVQAKYVQVQALPTASASTMDALYLVPSALGTPNVYDVYYTTEVGRETYSWIMLCTTEINLSNYATKAEVDQLEHKATPLFATGVKTMNVDASSLALRNYYIDSSTGKYTTSNKYKHSIFPVKPGQVVRVTANADNNSVVSFFKTDAAPVSGGTPDYSDAYASIYRVSVAANTYQDFIVPSDAFWCYVYRGRNDTTPKYQSTPSAISIELSTLDPDGKLDDVVSTDAASVSLVADAVFDGADYDSEAIDLSAVPSQSLSIDGNNAFESTGAHGMIEVNPDDVLMVVGGGGRASFVSGIYCPNDGSTVGAISTMVLVYGKTYILRAPSGTQGFIYNTNESESAVSPSAIVKYTPSDREEGTLRTFSAIRYIVSGGLVAYGAYSNNRDGLFKVKAGHSYCIEFTSDAPTQNLYFITELPYIGLAATSVSLTINANHIGKKCSISLNPSADGFYLFRFNKSGGPTVTVNAYDADETSKPVSGTMEDNTLEYWRQDVYALTKRNYSIDLTNGLYGANTSYKHILLPVSEGQFVKVRAGSSNTRLAWFTEEDTPTSYGVPPFLPGTTIFSRSGGIFRVPAGARFLYVYAGAGSAYANFPEFLGISIDKASMPDIVRDNGYENTRRVLFQIGSTTRAENDDSYKPLVLLHYSDIHGSVICQNRINDFRDYFKGYITDTIQTGDLVESYWANGSAFGDESDPDNPCKDILCVIGNHDTASKSGGTFYWHTYQGKQSYDRYFAPWIANWNVTQPEDAEENGYCFYYKDYAASKIRLIVLDTFDNDAGYMSVQQSWCQSVLADARTNGLSVIMVSHFRLECESLLKSPFTVPSASLTPDTSSVNNPYIALVKNFIDAGGELVCWITGHSHYDAVSKTSEANGSQINICVGNAGRFYTVDNVLWETNSRIGVDPNDWKTFDLFNLMAVDTYYKTIILFRVGSNWDKMGRKVETCCIKYNTGEVFYP